jgi:hypothetical protein
MCQIKHVTTTPYHPQSNGRVEWLNGTLKQMLRCIAAERAEYGDWDEHLPIALLSYRTSKHSAIEMSPLEATTGHPGVAHPVEQAVRNPSHYLDDNDVEMTERFERVERIATEVQQNENLLKQSANEKLKPLPTYQIGDQVLVKKESYADTEHPMVANKFTGPWKVVEIKSPLTIKVRLDSLPVREITVHISKIKPLLIRKERLSLLDQDVIHPQELSEGEILLIRGADSNKQLWIAKFIRIDAQDESKLHIQWFQSKQVVVKRRRGKRTVTIRSVAPFGPFTLRSDWNDEVHRSNVMLVFSALNPDGSIPDDILKLAQEVYAQNQLPWPQQQ